MPLKHQRSQRHHTRKRGPSAALIASVIGLGGVLGVFIAVERTPDATAGAEAPAAQAPAPSSAAPATSPTAALPIRTSGANRAFTPAVLSSTESGFDITERKASPPLTSKAAFVKWMLSHTDQKEKYLAQRWDRAQAILQRKQITQQRILEAFLRTPREFFARDIRRSYENAVLPIGYGQTISGPHMVALMTDHLDPQAEHRVLEVGTGSGYQSALLAELSNHVYTIEIVPALARETNAIYKAREAKYPEYSNIHRKLDDGYYGWPEYAPFDRIIVTCGIDHVPPELLRQLAPEGIMVIPVGPPSGQIILKITKHVSADGAVSLQREDIFEGKRKEIFVPFTAKEGGVHRAGDRAGEPAGEPAGDPTP
jgi:protein-L-isoaspartate(D-aspartate) O-methyltransferase